MTNIRYKFNFWIFKKKEAKLIFWTNANPIVEMVVNLCKQTRVKSKENIPTGRQT